MYPRWQPTSILSPEIVKIIRPGLHHTSPFIQVLGVVVSGSNVISFNVCELALNCIGMPTTLFVEEGRGHGPETVPGHLVLVVAEVAKGRVDGVLGHRPSGGSSARKEILTVSGEELKFLENCDGLSGERHQMNASMFHLLRRDAPLGGFEIDVWPLSMAKFPGAHKNKRSKAKGSPGDGGALVPADRP